MFTKSVKVLISQCRKLYGLVFKEPRKSVFFTIVKKKRLGTRPKIALSIDKEFDRLENVNVLSSNLVILYRAMPPLVRVER